MASLGWVGSSSSQAESISWRSSLSSSSCCSCRCSRGGSSLLFQSGGWGKIGVEDVIKANLNSSLICIWS